MPSVDIKQVVDTKPLSFTIKTGNGHWKCQIHSDRAAYERSRVKAPGLARTDSGFSSTTTVSSTSSSSAASTSSSH
ncbi:uncharacterized protein F4822DRAFT_94020 [Hypoxylon trugodes]|uniref:uncharacterized protein n=1 Tax=Hypoxylon trugodes TaxID=326681 RepID=UPI00218E66A0|nr:uncharacterized protein F4822DRAFT_94020 [Hypoxylon trugodes]KAI1383148.1 hypothetical protein F4822DRAFT_94020 [Hypoxylon trugodes]